MTSLVAAAIALAFSANAEGTSIVPAQHELDAGILSGAWTVEEGMLVGRAEPGTTAWWRTPNAYWDFEVAFDFRTPQPANGGLHYRAHWLPVEPVAPDGPRTMYGYHANIDTLAPERIGEVLSDHGAPPLSAAAKAVADAYQPGAWNRMRVRAVGPVAHVFLNDTQVATVYDERMIGGFLAFQVAAEPDTAAEIQYRAVRLRDLGRTGSWRPLFHPDSLEGWTNWGSEQWTVHNGVIQGRRGPNESEGYLATQETWRDFRVRGEFRMLGGGNYGLFYHASIHLRDDGYPIIAGVQGEVEPDYPGETGGLYESYGRGWLARPKPASVEAWLVRPDDWNAIEIRLLGNKTTTWVNGFRVLDVIDREPQRFHGSFALQLHTGDGAGINWRNLHVQDAPTP